MWQYFILLPAAALASSLALWVIGFAVFGYFHYEAAIWSAVEWARTAWVLQPVNTLYDGIILVTRLPEAPETSDSMRFFSLVPLVTAMFRIGIWLMCLNLLLVFAAKAFQAMSCKLSYRRVR